MLLRLLQAYFTLVRVVLLLGSRGGARVRVQRPPLTPCYFLDLRRLGGVALRFAAMEISVFNAILIFDGTNSARLDGPGGL